MKKTSEPIVFFGSGPVAAESLRLLARDFTIEAVVTKPRPAHHRGEFPVLSVAETLGLEVKTAATKDELDELFSTHPFNSRAAVLVDFGIIVSQKVIDYFPLGIVNSHFSVLPQWRGADPITFAVLSGQKQTGVSLMLLVAAMDEGPLLGYGEYDLPADITTPRLTSDLIALSHQLLQQYLPKYLSGDIEPLPQDVTGREVSYSRKLSKQDGILDWSKPANELERQIRAFIEWPKSQTTVGSLHITVTAAHVEDMSGTAGTKAIVDKKPAVYCGQKCLVIDRLKPAGKKEMTGESFLAGYKNQFLS
jgi:methionyl-tRNA formyltransferase